MDCECRRMATCFDEKWVFGNGHNQHCKHFEETGLSVYEVDCGEVDTVLAHSFEEAIALARGNGCNADMEHYDSVEVRRLSFEDVQKKSFRDEEDGEVSLFIDVSTDKTPRVICSSIW